VLVAVIAAVAAATPKEAVKVVPYSGFPVNQAYFPGQQAYYPGYQGYQGYQGYNLGFRNGYYPGQQSYYPGYQGYQGYYPGYQAGYQGYYPGYQGFILFTTLTLQTQSHTSSNFLLIPIFTQVTTVVTTQEPQLPSTPLSAPSLQPRSSLLCQLSPRLLPQYTSP